jgi:predicted metal-dependent enzyme (double-stranded beta helix superfamily)
MVDAVSPVLGDVPQVRNACSDRVSISIHACGAGIGAIKRAIYSPDGAVTPFRSACAYANAATRSAP